MGSPKQHKIEVHFPITPINQVPNNQEARLTSNRPAPKGRMATIINNNNTTVIIGKETRHCGLCGSAGHNRRTCPTAPKEEKKATPPPSLAPPKEEITYWSPHLFSGGGVRPLPAAVAWAPGTDSVAFYAQMKAMPFYKFDSVANVWRRQ